MHHHPFIKLAISEGELVLLDQQVGRYMDCPPISLTSDIPVNSRPQGTRIGYRFRLTAAPDVLWRTHFGSALKEQERGFLENVAVEFVENTMVLLSFPVNFARRFDAVKKAITRANELYQIERQFVLDHVRYLSGRKRHSQPRNPARLTENKARILQEDAPSLLPPRS